MLKIHCPYCQETREEEEFHYSGQAHIARPPDPDSCSDEDWGNYLYFRKNPRGRHMEMWVHVAGCRKFFNVVRDTITYEVEQTYLIGHVPREST
jgi:sarcosine oxidase subunit delta